jgi:hypothetical protein
MPKVINCIHWLPAMACPKRQEAIYVHREPGAGRSATCHSIAGATSIISLSNEWEKGPCPQSCTRPARAREHFSACESAAGRAQRAELKWGRAAAGQTIGAQLLCHKPLWTALHEYHLPARQLEGPQASLPTTAGLPASLPDSRRVLPHPRSEQNGCGWLPDTRMRRIRVVEGSATCAGAHSCVVSPQGSVNPQVKIYYNSIKKQWSYKTLPPQASWAEGHMQL